MLAGGIADAFNALLAVDQRQEVGRHAFLIKMAEATWPVLDIILRAEFELVYQIVTYNNLGFRIIMYV